jgi:hypothetical protein
MTHGKRSIGVAIALGFGLTGCGASTPRDGAKMLAAYTSNVKDQIFESSRKRAELDTEQEQNISLLEDAAATTEQNNAATLTVFKIAAQPVAGVSDASLFEGVRGATAPVATAPQNVTAATKREDAPEASNSPGGNEVRAEKLATTAKDLAQLADAPSLTQDATFYIQYGKSVKQAMDDSKSKAQSKAQTGLDVAKQKNSELQKQILSTVGSSPGAK